MATLRHACRYLGACVKLDNISYANFINRGLYNISIPPQCHMRIVLLFLKAAKLKLLFIVVDGCNGADDQASQQHCQSFHPLNAVVFFFFLFQYVSKRRDKKVK
jgi:hypothetical protein